MNEMLLNNCDAMFEFKHSSHHYAIYYSYNAWSD